jgi:hypothetical protein
MNVPADSWKKIDVASIDTLVTESPIMIPIGVDNEKRQIKMMI